MKRKIFDFLELITLFMLMFIVEILGIVKHTIITLSIVLYVKSSRTGSDS